MLLNPNYTFQRMNTIQDILRKHNKFDKNPAKNGRPINIRWEKAREFGEYVGLPIPVVLRLFKLYGETQVLSIRGWLYDVPHDPSRGGKIALAHWRLKQLREEQKKTM